MTGIFRDGHPRLVLSLPGTDEVAALEFIVDTGFEGGLAIPVHFAHQIEGTLEGTRFRQLANGQQIPCPFMDVTLLWNGEQRQVEVLLIGGAPLLGTELLQSCLLQVEVEEGGDVLVEAL